MPGAVAYLLVAAAVLTLLLRRRAPLLAVAVAAAVTAPTSCWLAFGPILLVGPVWAWCLTAAMPLRRAVPWLAVFVAGAGGGRGRRAWSTTSAGAGCWCGRGVAGTTAAGAVTASRWPPGSARRPPPGPRQARRAVCEERLRMAQELHDVVGHGLAVIAMQAGVAAARARPRPDQGRGVARGAPPTSRESLDGLRAELEQLRAPADAAARGPGPGLADLPCCSTACAAAGCGSTPRCRPPAGCADRGGLRRVPHRAGVADQRAAARRRRPGAGPGRRRDGDARWSRSPTADAAAARTAATAPASAGCARGPPALGGTLDAGPRQRRFGFRAGCRRYGRRCPARTADPARLTARSGSWSSTTRRWCGWGCAPCSAPSRHRAGRRGRGRAGGARPGARDRAGRRPARHPDAGPRRAGRAARRSPPTRRWPSVRVVDAHHLRARRVRLRGAAPAAPAASSSRTPTRQSCCRRCASSPTVARCCRRP